MNNYEMIDKIKKSITTYANDKYQTTDLIIEIEQPNDIKNGHFSTNFALKNSKLLKKNPKDIALEYAATISGDEYIKSVEVAGPGFINFYLKENYFTECVSTLLNGELVVPRNKSDERYNLEYVSANPTGELHLGHARNAIYSDSLYRIMKKSGYNIEREYYINDAGAQMKNLGLSVLWFYKEQFTEPGEFPEDGYRGAEIKALGLELYNEYKESIIDKDLSWFIEYAYKKNMEEIKHVLGELSIEFDVFSSEKYYHDNGMVKESLKVLDGFGDVYEKDGAIWLNTEKNGDDKDRVIEKSDHTHTYFTSDIAYHLDKFNRGYTKLIDVWGGDHHGYVNRVKAAIKSLGHEKEDLEIVLIQMVSIMRDNQIVKMSKRAGTSVTIRELISEVDVDAIRYFFVMRSPDTQLDFDIEVAKKENSDNPVYYVQYAHARIFSLLKTAKEKNVIIDNSLTNISEAEIELIAKLNNYSETINEAANKRYPHIVTNYLYDLAATYHRYYNAERVFGDDSKQTSNKIIIAMAIKRVLADGLGAIGIEAKNEM